MTSARRPAHGVRRWLALLLATPAVVGAVVGAVLLAAMGAAMGSATPAAALPLHTDLQLTTLAPVNVQPGDTLRARGTFSSTRTFDDVVVRLEAGTTPFLTRDGLSEAAATPPATTALFGATDELGKVRADDVRPFGIEIPADDLPFYAAGVYPLRVVAIDAQTGTVLDETSTFLPFAPEGVGVSPSRLLMFWPLIGTPSDVDPEAADAELAPAGRLDVLTRAGARAPATWLVDPALLDAADSSDSTAAHDWLDGYASDSARRDVVQLPYGDPDAAAISAAGRPRMLRAGWQKGDRVWQRVTGGTARSGLVWPADGAGDEQTLDVAGAAGASTVLLSEENVPLLSPTTYTPSGRLQWPDPALEVLLADPAASALVASPASTTTDVLLARQRFLAETLLHALELPSAPRLLVVAPPRRWDPSPLWADALVGAVRQASWLDPVSLDEAVKPEAPTVVRETPSIPSTAAERQLPTSMVDAALHGLRDNRRLTGILTKPQQLSGPFEDALFTSISTAWRSDPAAAVADQQTTLDDLADTRAKVRIVSRGGTLSDDRGSFPVSLRNQLDQAVVVRLDFTSSDPLRLRVSGPDGPIRIGPDESVSVSVDLDAVTSGRLAFDAQLLTRTSQPYDDPVTLLVDVRGFGNVALLVFGVAAALMVTAAVIRLVRRIRGARRDARRGARRGAP